MLQMVLHGHQGFTMKIHGLFAEMWTSLHIRKEADN